MISSWGIVRDKVKTDIENIFKGVDVNSLSFINKRKMIYDYMVNNFTIDTYLADSIKYARSTGVRNFYHHANELKRTAFDHQGLSFGLSVYYKFLLEEVGIGSYYVSYKKDNDKFGLNLIFQEKNKNDIIFDDEDNDQYYFDDVYLGILNKNTEKYFNYNIDTANKYGQGVDYLNNSMHWFITDESYICRCLFEVKKSFSKINTSLKTNSNNAMNYLNHYKNYYDAFIPDDNVKIRGR